MAGERTVLITGATGKQGGSLLRALAGQPFKIRAMTRHPESDAAIRLAGRGVEIVQGDLNDDASVERALKGMWGAYAVQNTWEAGVELEEQQGKRFAELARKAGVQHFVYSSVGSAHRNTGIPHFDNKYRVEQTIRGLGFPSHVIVRPVFFMENLTSPWFLNGDKLYGALAPETAVQMIAVEDVGRHLARAFTDATKMAKREIDIAGDSVTMPRVAEALSRGLGRQITFVRIPIEEVRKNSADFAIMLEWFERVGYDADIAGLARESGIKPTTIEEWAEKQRA
jgi:uncharacterized protein YbjT (DUF2867 family)